MGELGAQKPIPSRKGCHAPEGHQHDDRVANAGLGT
jgi:hypothetical protein